MKNKTEIGLKYLEDSLIAHKDIEFVWRLLTEGVIRRRGWICFKLEKTTTFNSQGKEQLWS